MVTVCMVARGGTGSTEPGHREMVHGAKTSGEVGGKEDRKSVV